MTIASLKPYSKLLTLVGISSAIVIAGTVFYILPTRNSIGTIMDDITDQRATLQALSLPDESLDVNIAEIESALTRVLGVTVDRNDAIEFISNIEQTAQTSDVKITLSIQEYDPEMTKTQDVTIQMSVSGSFTNLVRFLQELNSLPQYVLLTSVTIASTSADEENGNVRATLSGTTYWK